MSFANGVSKLTKGIFAYTSPPQFYSKWLYLSLQMTQVRAHRLGEDTAFVVISVFCEVRAVTWSQHCVWRLWYLVGRWETTRTPALWSLPPPPLPLQGFPETTLKSEGWR